MDVWLCCISSVCVVGLGNTWKTSGAFTEGSWAGTNSAHLQGSLSQWMCELLSQDPCFWLEWWSHLSWKGHLVPLPCSEQGCAELHRVLTACFPASASLVLPLEQSCIEPKLPELFINHVLPFWPTTCCLAQQPHFQRLCANAPFELHLRRLQSRCEMWEAAHTAQPSKLMLLPTGKLAA